MLVPAKINNPFDRGREAERYPPGPAAIIIAGRPIPAARLTAADRRDGIGTDPIQLSGPVLIDRSISSHCSGGLSVGRAPLCTSGRYPPIKNPTGRADAPRVPTSSSFALTFDSLSGVMVFVNTGGGGVP